MFAIRKIKKGSVRINKKTYRPIEPYNGELDELWYAFGLYDSPSMVDGKSFVSLWGTKDQYWDWETYKNTWGYTPDCIDGVFHWAWWKEQ